MPPAPQPLRFAGLAFAALCASTMAAAAAPPAFPREAGLPFVQLFRRNDYRGHAQVWCGATDARGLLYFGNYAQVLVYDGGRWERVAVPGATFIRALALDSRGRLWVGGAGAVGYIDTAAAAAPRFVSLRDRLPAEAREAGDITRVHVLGDSVFFQSQAWLLRWRAEKFDAWPLGYRAPTQSLVLGHDLLVQNPARGWWRVGANGLEAAAASFTSLDTPMRFALPMTGDRWVVGSLLAGLFVYDGRGLSPAASEADAFFRTHILFNGLRLASGRFAMATRTGGVVILAPDLSFEAIIGDAAELAGNRVNNVFADAHGGLWLCLDDGLARVSEAFEATWFPPPGPLARLQGFALERFRGRLHLGAARDLMRLDPPKEIGAARWEPREKFGQHITALLAAGDTLLIGAEDGLFALREGGTRQRIGSVRHCTALLASATAPERIFVAHGAGIGILRRAAGDWKPLEPILAANGEVRSLAEDAAGTLWATTGNNQLLRIAFSTTAGRPDVKSFEPGHRQIRLVRAGGQPLVVSERALHRIDDGGRLVPEPVYGARFVDGTTPVRALVEDADGAMWIAPQHAGDSDTWSETTLGRATRSGGWEPLDLPDLERVGDINGLRLERENGREILWVVGVSGILRVDLAATRAARRPAGVTLVREAIAAGQRSLLGAGPSAPIVLPYAQNSLRFRVAAPAFAALPGVQFETEVAGIAPDGARHSSASAERELTNLWEGRYLFRARAHAGDGRWTVPAEFAFVVLPPWWRAPWAYATWALLAAGGVVGVVRLRTRALRRRADALEETVAERTMELHARNQELTRLHKLELDEKITAQLAEEKARLEMLRYQLNPHFLFNTLNSLYGLVEDHPAASDMVLRLSEFCRHTLTRGADHVQTLGDEIQVLSTYLDIEKVRWGDSLRITIDVDPAAANVRIPPFLLLPLIENAIKHGGETSRTILELRLTARIVGSALEIEVANTGRWLAPGTSPARSTHIGLENLRERLRRSYPDSHDMGIAEREGWVVVTLRLAKPETGNRRPERKTTALQPTD